MPKKDYGIIILLISLVIFNFCKKKFDAPPFAPASDGAHLSIAQLKARIADTMSAYKFGVGDTNLYCTVTCDETSGNLFRLVYVRDEGGDALRLNLVDNGGLFTGDRIRVNLNNLMMVNSNNVI